MDILKKIRQDEVILHLQQSQKEFITLFQENLLSVEIYKPHKRDKQKPHDKDEFYLIISGNGKFRLEDQITSFKEGDFIFVPAHAEHQFFAFSADFITWVFFIG